MQRARATRASLERARPDRSRWSVGIGLAVVRPASRPVRGSRGGTKDSWRPDGEFGCCNVVHRGVDLHLCRRATEDHPDASFADPLRSWLRVGIRPPSWPGGSWPGRTERDVCRIGDLSGGQGVDVVEQQSRPVGGGKAGKGVVESRRIGCPGDHFSRVDAASRVRPSLVGLGDGVQRFGGVCRRSLVRQARVMRVCSHVPKRRRRGTRRCGATLTPRRLEPRPPPHGGHRACARRDAAVSGCDVGSGPRSCPGPHGGPTRRARARHRRSGTLC